jgi:cell division septation protein DedD
MISDRQTLHELVDKLVDGYLSCETDSLKLKETSVAKEKEYLQQIKELKESLVSKETECSDLESQIRQLNRDKHDYETMINSLNQTLEDSKKEQKETDRHSMIKVQAKELEEKDRIIDRLEETILKLKGDTTLDTKEARPKKSKPKKKEPEPQPEKEPVKEPKPQPEKEPVKEPEPQPEEEEIETVVSELVNEDPSESESDDEVWIKVKNKGHKYYIVKGETPQYIYEIDEDDQKGKRVGHRTESKTKSGKKKYVYDLYE